MVKKKKSDNFSKKIIVVIAIIILIIVLFFIAIKFTGRVVGQVTGQITGDATSTAIYNCTDSDNGVQYFVKGVCEDHKQKYEDACYGGKGLWEYYCPRDKYACIKQETACPYGCFDGRCLKKGENTTVAEPSPVDNTGANTPVDNTGTNTPVDNTGTNNPVNNSPGEIPPNEEITKNNSLIIFIIFGIIIIVFLVWFIFIKKSPRSKKSSLKLTWR